jgi:hypothetical protein
MEYYKYHDEYSDIAPAMTYLEVEGEWALRQITFNGERYLTSNVDMDLPEKEADYHALVEEGEVIPISKQEFDSVWNAHLALRQNQWETAKRAYPIDKAVQGSLKLFFPQGVIVNLDGGVLGVADYQACRASTTWENMYPRHKITAVVSGYDEINQWIVLASAQVHAEEVSN